MKKYLAPVLFTLIFIVSCKKSDTSPNTFMTVQINGDSTWSVNKVTTNTANDFTTIYAERPNTQDYIMLYIKHYIEGKHSYIIQNTGTVVNLDNSSVNCMYNYYNLQAVTGDITVTGYTSNTISGTFNYVGQNSSVKGTFTASHP